MIRARNFRCHGSELDIIACKGQTLAIVEVKARRRRPRDLATQASLLSPRKRAALIRGARHYLTTHADTTAIVRIDLALVVWNGKSPTVIYEVGIC